MDCATLMEQTLRREKSYILSTERRSHSKTRPLGDGKTPDILEDWVGFDAEVNVFWSETRSNLALVECRSFQRRGMLHGVITEETDVRSCFCQCIAQPVTFAVRQGLGEQLAISSASSGGISNVDVAGFITAHRSSLQDGDLHSSDSESATEDNDSEDCPHDYELLEEVIPIEVKPYWQLLIRRNTTVVQMMASEEKIAVRNALSQIYLYMVLEEARYGILTTKDRTVFLRQTLEGTLKRLEASRTICYDDPIGVRKCFLFMLMKAKEADRCPISQTWTTAEDNKWIPPVANKRQSPLTRVKMKALERKRKEARTSRGRGSATRGRRGRSEASQEAAAAVEMLSDDEDIVRLGDEDVPKDIGPCTMDAKEEEWMVWAKSLKKLDLGHLHLVHMVKKSGTRSVWKGKVLGIEAAIKVYDFCESLDDLPSFHREVCIYEKLSCLQGSIIPFLIDFGMVWDGFLGFLAMSWAGPELVLKRTAEKGKRNLLLGLECFHSCGIVHGDLHHSNILHGKKRGSFVFVDFEHSRLANSTEEMEEEMQDFRALLNL